MLWEQVDDMELNFMNSDYKFAMEPNYQVSSPQLVQSINKTDKFFTIMLFANYISQFFQRGGGDSHGSYLEND